MGRALGINARLNAVFEATYGTTPGSGFRRMPFISSNLGEERQLVPDDQIGLGRETQDPELGVATNDGDVVVPVDTQALGIWLKGLLGAPVTTSEDPYYLHTFTSGATPLPSISIETGHPEVPAYSVNFGALVNQMRIPMARSGRLNATFGLICQGETSLIGSSVAGTPTAWAGKRMPMASGYVKEGGTTLAGVTAADITLANNFEKVETIRADGRIDGADPLKFMASGSITLRFASLTEFNAAVAGTPVSLEFGWGGAGAAMSIVVSRVFLPRVKRAISGEGGIQATIPWQASGASGASATVYLRNNLAFYT